MNSKSSVTRPTSIAAADSLESNRRPTSTALHQLIQQKQLARTKQRRTKQTTQKWSDDPANFASLCNDVIVYIINMTSMYDVPCTIQKRFGKRNGQTFLVFRHVLCAENINKKVFDMAMSGDLWKFGGQQFVSMFLPYDTCTGIVYDSEWGHDSFGVFHSTSSQFYQSAMIIEKVRKHMSENRVRCILFHYVIHISTEPKPWQISFVPPVLSEQIETKTQAKKKRKEQQKKKWQQPQLSRGRR